MHTVVVNLISDQDMDFYGRPVNVHHIRSIVVEGNSIYNIALQAGIVLEELRDCSPDESYWYFNDERIVGELLSTEDSLGEGNGYSWLLTDEDEEGLREALRVNRVGVKLKRVLVSIMEEWVQGGLVREYP